MSEESRKFSVTASTKKCFVLLERLSENVLNQYLGKQEYTSISKTSVNCKCPENRRSSQKKCGLHSVKKRSRRRKEEPRRSHESAVKGDYIQRKRRSRAKRLSFSDDEVESPAVPNGNIPEGSATERTIDVGQSLSVALREENSNPVPVALEQNIKNIKEINFKVQTPELADMNGNFTIKQEVESLSLSLQTCEESTEKEGFNICNEMKHTNNSDKYKFCEIKREMEIIEECTESTNFERDKTITDSLDSTRVIPENESESEESESRDEDEDDRETVIFENNSNENSFVVENTQKSIESVTENFKKKMMNRKKGRLVKFKKKRRMGVPSGKLKKHTTVFSKACGTGEESSVKDVCLREVCVLVKRIHELYKIILQLQKNLPKDSEQVDDFIRTINAQKENFHREVKQNEKIITEGYNSMLKCYGNANKVSREIGRRTSMSKDDVADVIAWCLIAGRNTDERKMNKETDKGESNVPAEEIQSKRCEMGEEYSKKLKRLIHDKIRDLLSVETVQDVHQTRSVHAEKLAKGGPSYAFKQNTVADSVSMLFPLSFIASGQSPSKTPQRPSNEPRPKPSTGSGNSVVAYSPQHFSRAPAPQGYQEQRIPYSKPRPYFWPQKSNAMARGPRHRECPQPNSIRVNPPGAHERLFRVRAQFPTNIGAPHHLGFLSVAPNMPMNYPSGTSVDPSQLLGGVVPPEHLPRNTRPALPSLMNLNVQPPVFNQERWVSHFPNTDDTARYPCTRPVQNPGRSEYGSEPPQRNRRSNSSVARDTALHSRNVHSMARSLGNNAPTQATGPAQGNYRGFVHPQTPAYPMQHPTVSATPENQMEMYRRGQHFSVGSTVALEEDSGHTLDPTVPQKLTMRNWRLEAEPIVESNAESSFSECSGRTFQWHQPLVEESVSSETGNESGAKDSNGRVYMCAQNGCKNSGLRVCRGCQSVIYCSETCQLKHWTLKHKMECYQLKELRG